MDKLKIGFTAFSSTITVTGVMVSGVGIYMFGIPAAAALATIISTIAVPAGLATLVAPKLFQTENTINTCKFLSIAVPTLGHIYTDFSLSKHVFDYFANTPEYIGENLLGESPPTDEAH